MEAKSQASPSHAVSDASSMEQDGQWSLRESTSQSEFSHSTYTPSDLAKATGPHNLPGTGFFRRMPCKARGVPAEHVARNAYIDIPFNAKHGTILKCSHPTCRMSGRLFRFCAVCQVPVAKRNFARRHTHGLSISQIISSADTDENTPTRMTAPTESPTMFKKSPSVQHPSPTLNTSGIGSQPAAVLSSVTAMVDKSVPGEISIDEALKQTRTLETVNNFTMNISVGSINSSAGQQMQTTKTVPSCKTTVQVTEDELDWLYLFRQKPGRNESKEGWLKRVEQVTGLRLREETSRKRIHKQIEDDELSEIEASTDTLASFDDANIEDLFE